LDQGSGRITTAGSGIDGTTLLAGGGDQLTQIHGHGATVNDPEHAHTVPSGAPGGSGLGGPGPSNNIGGQVTGSSATGISVTNANYGAGNSQNIPPVYIGGLTLIRAG
jgi:hypothetical protein